MNNPGRAVWIASDRRGLTLIELLAVIALLLVFFSLLMPAIRGLQQRADTVICQSHIRTISVE